MLGLVLSTVVAVFAFDISSVVSLILLLLGFFWSLIGAALILAADKEYAYWAPRVGSAILRFALLLIPKATRDCRAAEWFAELDLLAAKGQGLVFALYVLVSSPVTWFFDRRNAGAYAPGSVAASASGVGVKALRFVPVDAGNYSGYCVMCRAKTAFGGEEVTMKNGRRAAKGQCPICGTSVMRMLGR
jgi:hypothetical protein